MWGKVNSARSGGLNMESWEGRVWGGHTYMALCVVNTVVVAVPSNHLISVQVVVLLCGVCGTACTHNTLEWCAVEAVVLVSIWVVNVGNSWCRLWGDRWIIAVSVVKFEAAGAVNYSTPQWPCAWYSLWVHGEMQCVHLCMFVCTLTCVCTVFALKLVIPIFGREIISILVYSYGNKLPVSLISAIRLYHHIKQEAIQFAICWITAFHSDLVSLAS